MARLRGPNGGFMRGPDGGSVSISTASAVLHSITLTDTSTAGSTGFFRRGVAFAKGDVASGRILKGAISGTPIRLAMMETKTWSDGSLMKATVVGDAGTIGSGASVTVDITSEVGTQATSGVDPFAYLATQDALTVEIRSHTGSTDNTNVGDLDFNLTTAVATSSRREIQGDTDVCVRAFAWQQVGNDQHLICLNYFDLWLNSGGSVVAVEWAPVMSQHWWVDDPLGTAQTKQERNYAATMKSGTTSLETFTGLNHAYYCQWAGLRTADDAQHAKRHWIDKGSAMPALRSTFSSDSLKRMMRAGYIPPVDLTATYPNAVHTGTATATSPVHPLTYDPLGRNGHKEAINGTGGYEGRGVICNQDAIAVCEQTADRWRAARVAAQASLSVFHHIKDHRNASGGSFNGDASMGMFPQKVARAGAQTYTGLAAEALVFSQGAGTEITQDAPNAAPNAENPQGFFAAWDSAHHVSYGYFVGFIEGERYLADAMVDHLNHMNTEGTIDFNTYPIMWATSNPANANEFQRSSDLSLDSTTTYGHIHLRDIQERSIGWSQYSWDHAYALLPDGDRHLPFMAVQMQEASDMLQATIDELPASQLLAGTVWNKNPPILSVFMHSMTSQCLTRTGLITEDTYLGYKEYNDLVMRYLRDTLFHNPYASAHNNNVIQKDDLDAQDYVARTDRFAVVRATIDNVINPAATTFKVATFGFPGSATPDVGDQVIFSGAGSPTIPPGVNAGQIYFITAVTISGPLGFESGNIEVATTSGGTAIKIADSAVSVDMGIAGTYLSETALGDNGTTVPLDDSFMTIMNAAVEYSYGAQNSEVSTSDVTQIRTFFAPKTYNYFSTWNMDGSQMR